MADRLGELQDAMMAVLRADPGVAAAFGGNKVRIFDLPPQASASSPFPYITLADAHDTALAADCLDSGDVAAQIHVWSRTSPSSTREAKRIAAAAVDALKGPDALDRMASNRLVDALPLDTIVLQDTDGQTVHAIARLQVSVDAL